MMSLNGTGLLGRVNCLVEILKFVKGVLKVPFYNSQYQYTEIQLLCVC